VVASIFGFSANECYKEGLYVLRFEGKMEQTRAGKVLSVPYPTIMTLSNPRDRIVTDPLRNANPFFHVLEFVWMMAGRDDADWISTFNSRMTEFANGGQINGAYGKRWRNWHGVDQIPLVAARLRRDPQTRQAVLAMWDPLLDNELFLKDYPCNTHIYFRVNNNQLHMTVCNRSNDLIWGMMGANIVHMTFLHELVSRMVGIPMGRYQVMTNNLHIYEHHWPLIEMAGSIEIQGLPEDRPYVLEDGEKYESLVQDCRDLCDGTDGPFRTRWINEVAFPMYQAYLLRGRREEFINQITATDWREACHSWNSRKSPPTGELVRYADITPKPS
jgi:thymidylate synthase